MAVLGGIGTATASWAETPSESAAFVAGVRPQERPTEAPVVRETAKDAGWYGKALTGVAQPYPYSLRFLEDQGGWYTPFTEPGMTGPYDLRGWHREALEVMR